MKVGSPGVGLGGGLRTLWQRAAGPWTLAALLACDGGDQGHRPAAETPAPVAPSPAVAPGDSAHQAPPQDPLQRAARSRAALVKAILTEDLVELTPASASLHFAPLTLTTKPGVGDNMLAIGKSDQDELAIGFRRESNGPWHFAFLRLVAPAGHGAQAAQAYEELSDLASHSLSTPIWIKDEPPYLARGYHFTDQLDVTIGAVMNRDEGRPYATIVIAPGPPVPTRVP